MTDEEWKSVADRAYAAADNETHVHGLTVFLEVFDDGCKRWESRGTPPPEDAEVASLKARIAELRANWDACHEQHKAALDRIDKALSELRIWRNQDPEGGYETVIDLLTEPPSPG